MEITFQDSESLDGLNENATNGVETRKGSIEIRTLGLGLPTIRACSLGGFVFESRYNLEHFLALPIVFSESIS